MKTMVSQNAMPSRQQLGGEMQGGKERNNLKTIINIFPHVFSHCLLNKIHCPQNKMHHHPGKDYCP